jgi:hypothetical protein
MDFKYYSILLYNEYVKDKLREYLKSNSIKYSLSDGRISKEEEMCWYFSVFTKESVVSLINDKLDIWFLEMEVK